MRAQDLTKRCGGCRTWLEAVMGDGLTWICPNLACSYEGPTRAELFDIAVREAWGEKHDAGFICELRGRGWRDEICERCGTGFLTARLETICVMCFSPEERLERGIVLYGGDERQLCSATQEMSGDGQE